MIRIMKPDFAQRRCNGCHNDWGVREITFSNGGWIIDVALCSKCMKELKDEIEKDTASKNRRNGR